MSSKPDPKRLLDEPSYFVRHYLGEDPFDYQEQFMDHSSNRKIASCGRRVGKSTMAAWLALWNAITHGNNEVLITAKAQRQSMELFNEVKSQMRHSDVSEEQWGVERSTRTEISFDNGSRILSLPVGRDGSNIRGYGADFLIVDEAAFIPDEIFQEVLSPMLAVGDGTFVLLSTPFGKSGFFYNRWDDATLDDDMTNNESTEWYPLHVPTSANPLIDDSFIDEQQKALTSMQFKQEILGKFEESADSFFTRSELENCATTDHVSRTDNNVAYLGVDLAGGGADKSVYISIDGNGNLFDVTSTDKPLTDAMGRIPSLNNEHDYTKIMVDYTSLGEGVVDKVKERLGTRVEGVKFTNEKKQSMYNTLKNELQDGMLTYQFVPGAGEETNQMFHECLSLEYEFTSTGKTKISHPSGGHDDYCLSTDTEILTTDGWESYSEYSSEDVATYRNGKIEYQTPSRVIDKQYDGEMLHMTGNNVDQLVTPNHKVVYQYKGKDGGDVVWKRDSSTAESFESLSNGTRYANRRIPTTGSQDTSGVNLEDWELSLMGWMITEGWISEEEYSRRYMIGQSNEEYIEKIEDIVDSFNPTKYKRDDGCIYWQFHTRDNEYFDELLSGGIHQIPRYVLTEATSQQLKILFDAMMDGDGTWSRMTYSTQNEELANQFQELCHKIGYRASISSVSEETEFGEYNGYEVYVISKEAEYARISDIERVEYDGTVWCVTVPNGTIVTRRNGTISVTGNCDALALAVWAKNQKQFARPTDGSAKPFTLGSLRTK